MLLRHNIPKLYFLIHSVDVWRSVESQLLQDHWEAGGGGAGVPDRGGAHLQPFLRAAGEVCGLLRRREAGVSSHHNHKCHHAGEWDTNTVESHFNGGGGLDPQQSCEDRAALQPKKLFLSLLCLLLANQTGKKYTSCPSLIDLLLLPFTHDLLHLSAVENQTIWAR